MRTSLTRIAVAIGLLLPSGSFAAAQTPDLYAAYERSRAQSLDLMGQWTELSTTGLEALNRTRRAAGLAPVDVR